MTKNLIKRTRKALGETQKQFAMHFSGVNQAVVSKWENQLVKPSPMQLKAIKALLKPVPVSQVNTITSQAPTEIPLFTVNLNVAALKKVMDLIKGV